MMALSSISFDNRSKQVYKEVPFNIGDGVSFIRGEVMFKGTVTKMYDNSALIELFDTPEYEFNNTVCNFKRMQLL